MDWLIELLLKQNMRGWRAQALNLKWAEEDNFACTAFTPSTDKAVRAMGDTGLLDVLAASFEEVSRRAESRPDLHRPIAIWLCKSGDPRSALANIEALVAKHLGN
tara:strand:- start:132 stop:446 length:315 start_codon:yes stop_codon:yes gene_type:complete